MNRCCLCVCVCVFVSSWYVLVWLVKMLLELRLYVAACNTTPCDLDLSSWCRRVTDTES